MVALCESLTLKVGNRQARYIYDIWLTLVWEAFGKSTEPSILSILIGLGYHSRRTENILQIARLIDNLFVDI
jgi:hypothetical protein